MIEETRTQPDAADAPAAAVPAAPAPTPASGSSVAAAAQDGVDPFDYAETIVRDLALHVGSRLRDFRADLAALHGTVAQMPEALKIGTLAQGMQDLRERVASLTGLVNNHLGRPSEEVLRLGGSLNDLAQRVAGVESWIAASRHAGPAGNLPDLPVPSGGFVAMEQFDRVLDQVHESVMRVVGAVREMQLDLRDLRTEVRDGRPPVPADAAPVQVPVPVPAVTADGYDPRGDLARLSGRLELLEERVAAQPAPSAPVVQPPAAPAPAGMDTAGLAALVFGAWSRLGQPNGAESLRAAVEHVADQLAARLGDMVRAPQLARGPGLVAVASGRVRGTDVVALLAVEDFCGRSWLLQSGGTELSCLEPPTTRTAGWRTLLSACALVARTRPGVRVVPVLVYGNGRLNAVPTAADIAAAAAGLNVADSASRLVQIAADGTSLPELLSPSEAATALTDALG